VAFAYFSQRETIFGAVLKFLVQILRHSYEEEISRCPRRGHDEKCTSSNESNRLVAAFSYLSTTVNPHSSPIQPLNIIEQKRILLATAMVDSTTVSCLSAFVCVVGRFFDFWRLRAASCSSPFLESVPNTIVFSIDERDDRELRCSPKSRIGAKNKPAVQLQGRPNVIPKQLRSLLPWDRTRLTSTDDSTQPPMRQRRDWD